MDSVSDSLVRNMHTSNLLEVISCGSGSAPAVPPPTKEQILVLLLVWCPSTALSCSLRVTASLLVSPPCSRGAAGRQPSYDCTYGCAILEKMGYLCNLVGLQVLPHATSSDKDISKTREESVRQDIDTERATVRGHHMQKHPLFGGWLTLASPLHLLWPSFAPKQVKLIHNH